MKKTRFVFSISIALLIILSMLCFSGCSSSTNKAVSNGDAIKNQAIETAIALGIKHYDSYAKELEAKGRYKFTFDEPECVSAEIMENKYVDIRCSVTGILSVSNSNSKVSTIYYTLRLVLQDDGTFEVTDEFWGIPT